MIGVFMTFVRVVYGKMIYMSVPSCLLHIIMLIILEPRLSLSDSETVSIRIIRKISICMKLTTVLD